MNAIKKEWKWTILATWIGGLLTHTYRFFNFLPTGDTMHSFYGTGSTYQSGRWFLDWASKLSTNCELPWVNAVLSLLYISIAMIMVVELFKFKSKSTIILLSLSVVTFPTITSTFAYMFTADGYMMAFMLAVAGIYFTKRYQFGFVLGIICICLSMSTYQAYLSVSLVLVLLLCIQDVLLDDKNFLQTLQIEWKQGISVVVGAILNKISTSAINNYLGIELTSYQGINDVHLLTMEDTLSGVSGAWRAFTFFFQVGEFKERSVYSFLNQGVIILILLYTIYFIVKKKVYKRPFACFCVLLAFFGFPMLVYVIRFVSTQVVYHSLMVMALCFVYVFELTLLEYITETNPLERILKRLGILVIVGICYVNWLGANYAYYQMNFSYEKSYAIAMDVLSRVENLEGFDGTQPIAICGYYDATTEAIVPEKPELAGVSNEVVLGSQDHYLSMWKYCMGREYHGVSYEKLEELSESAIYQDMNVYPYLGCVLMVDDTVIVKLSDLE